mmetsp:Transcript_100673/g.259963  ORF Transcript_100673/g.259963 Transcript_100673/m.259963 type:complete len:409 (+) Transcript_100673:1211-2437(+)
MGDAAGRRRGAAEVHCLSQVSEVDALRSQVLAQDLLLLDEVGALLLELAVQCPGRSRQMSHGSCCSRAGRQQPRGHGRRGFRRHGRCYGVRRRPHCRDDGARGDGQRGGRRLQRAALPGGAARARRRRHLLQGLAREHGRGARRGQAISSSRKVRGDEIVRHMRKNILLLLHLAQLARLQGLLLLHLLQHARQRLRRLVLLAKMLFVRSLLPNALLPQSQLQLLLGAHGLEPRALRDHPVPPPVLQQQRRRLDAEDVGGGGLGCQALLFGPELGEEEAVPRAREEAPGVGLDAQRGAPLLLELAAYPDPSQQTDNDAGRDAHPGVLEPREGWLAQEDLRTANAHVLGENLVARGCLADGSAGSRGVGHRDVPRHAPSLATVEQQRVPGGEAAQHAAVRVALAAYPRGL